MKLAQIGNFVPPLFAFYYFSGDEPANLPSHRLFRESSKAGWLAANVECVLEGAAQRRRMP